jgi:membrane associated rhomboid family serine protease
MSSVPAPEAFPNAWKKPKKSTSPLAQQQQHQEDQQQVMQLQLQYVGIDGNRQTLAMSPNEAAEKKCNICCLMCCPCCVGGCGESNKQQYLSCLRSFTVVLVFFQIVLFVVALGVGGFADPRVNPLLGPCPRAFVVLGGMNAALVVREVQLWRLVLPLLLHAGVLHIAMNLFAELRFGLYIERRIGAWRVILIYLVGTLGGELLSGIWTRPLVSVGASAALMALMGAHFVELLCTWHVTNPLERKIALGQVVVWIVITLCLSALPIVDAGAHIGGLITGALLGCALFARLTTTLSPRAQTLLMVGGIVGVVAYIVTMFLVLFLAIDVGPVPTQAEIDFCG